MQLSSTEHSAYIVIALHTKKFQQRKHNYAIGLHRAVIISPQHQQRHRFASHEHRLTIPQADRKTANKKGELLE
jgi:hypothetical protein